MVATLCGCVSSCTWVDLFLLRHGIAKERINGLDHCDRPLTTRGRQRTKAVLAHLAAHGLRAERLIASPYRRALETAMLANDAGVAPPPELSTHLAPGGSPLDVLQGVSESCLLVGHEPDLSGLAATLLGIPPQTLRLRKAGLLHLRAPFALAWQPGTAQLEALLRPGLMVPKG